MALRRRDVRRVLAVVLSGVSAAPANALSNPDDLGDFVTLYFAGGCG